MFPVERSALALSAIPHPSHIIIRDIELKSVAARQQVARFQAGSLTISSLAISAQTSGSFQRDRRGRRHRDRARVALFAADRGLQGQARVLRARFRGRGCRYGKSPGFDVRGSPCHQVRPITTCR